MKNILVLCYSPLHRDPRVLTQYCALKNEFDITLAGFSNIEGNSNFVKLEKPDRTLMEKIIYYLIAPIGATSLPFWNNINKKNYELLDSQHSFDIIIANDLDILPIATKLKKDETFLIFDAHEYYPNSGQARGIRKIIKKRFNEFLLKRYLKPVDKMVTVATGIKQLYYKNFGKNPEVIMNLPNEVNLKRTIIDPKNIKIVHHGAALPNRKLELMIETMKYLDDSFSLTFYLVVSKNWEKYYEFLKDKANGINAKVFFNDPVETKEIPKELNKFDIGFFLLPPRNLNYLYALPNKLFEFIQSRLAIVIGPSVEMKSIVDEYNLGIVGDSFEPQDIAKRIKSTSIDELSEFKRNSDLASKKLNSNISKNQWLTLVNKGSKPTVY